MQLHDKRARIVHRQTTTGKKCLVENSPINVLVRLVRALLGGPGGNIGLKSVPVVVLIDDSLGVDVEHISNSDSCQRVNIYVCSSR